LEAEKSAAEPEAHAMEVAYGAVMGLIIVVLIVVLIVSSAGSPKMQTAWFRRRPTSLKKHNAH
jgi:hypothetical protein